MEENGLVCLFDAFRPGKQFFSHVGMEPLLPGSITSTFLGDKYVNFIKKMQME